MTQRNYLVVGGTSGIGQATVEVLLHGGANVIFCGRSREKGEKVAASFGQSRTHSAVFFRADITDTVEVEALFAFVESRFNNLDGAFNAVGVIGNDTSLRGGYFHESDEKNFDHVFAVNVKGIWRVLKHELRILARQKYGSIVNCSSVAGLRSADSLSVSYTASKHALIGMTRVLAVEYAPANIRLNVICPGVIQTDMINGMADQLLKDLRKKNAGARIGAPHEVATVVEFLLSDKSSYISGTTITIDAGGLTGAL